MVTLEILPRSKNLRKINADTDPQTRISALIREYSKVNDIDPSRVKFSRLSEEEDPKTKKPKRINLRNDLTLEENGLDFKDYEKSTVYAKDLGPQIGWRTVFIYEYLGPILIHSLFYFFIYDPTENSYVQKISFILTLLHYLKRELETVFVHSFSSDTMPLLNLFKNSGHYWIINGLFIAGTVYAPDSYRNHSKKDEYGYLKDFIFHVSDRSKNELIILVSLFAICELSNFYCHYILMKLRSDGSRDHKIPYGFAFKFVSFPNYFFEIASWFFFALINNNWSSYLFLLVGGFTMAVWAKNKHRKYKKEFGDKYPKERKAIIPFIY